MTRARDTPAKRPANKLTHTIGNVHGNDMTWTGNTPATRNENK